MSQSVDFDQVLQRQHGDSMKWRRYQDQDVVPMWVADMDFAAPQVVVDALQQRVAEGVYGYGQVPEGLAEALCHWYNRRYGWPIEPSWLVWLPGLVSGLHAVAKVFGEPGGGVMTHSPVYPPFLKVAERSDQQLIAVPMLEDNGEGQWQLDFAAMEQAITPETRLFMFCNPHNPTGRVFRREELEQVAEFCLKHDLLICSDEIHCDLVLEPELQHISIASMSEDIAQRSITLLAPSKTFNIAGLACSVAVIPNAKLRRQFNLQMMGLMPHVNILGYVAAQAAYEGGESWLEQLLDYLGENRQRLSNWLTQYPKLKMSLPEATFLGWIDFRAYGQDYPARWLLKEAGVALSEGADFGLPGFARINFGCPKAQLEQALTRIDRVLQQSPA